MKKFAFVLLMSLVVVGFAAAATNGVLTLGGTVNEVAVVTVGTGSSAFTITGDAQTVTLPSLTFNSNLKAWKVSAVANMNGGLKSTGDATLAQIPYTFTIADYVSAATLSTTATLSTSQSKTPKAGIEKAVSLHFDANSDYWTAANDYANTITVSIIAG